MNILTTDQSEAHLQLASGSGGAFLQSMIALVSVKLARFTGRDEWGPVQLRTEYHDGGTQYLLPRVWPVVSFSIYEDIDHAWPADSELDADDFYTTDSGIIFHEAGKLASGTRNIKLVCVGGYADAAAIPGTVQTAALIQLEREWNARKRPGRNGDNPSSRATDAEIMPEVASLLSPYVRRLPYV